MNKHREDSNYWIEKLKINNLTITDEKEFKEYIDNYNFFIFVKKYSKLLYKTHNENIPIYKEESNSQMIINLFNLDRRLSTLILEDIFIIERKLSTLIYKEIMNKNLHEIPELNEKYFYNLSDEEFYYIFPRLEKYIFNNNPQNKSSIIFFKELFFSKKGIKKKMIWNWISELTFGQLCEIFFLLTRDSKKYITYLFFKDFQHNNLYFQFEKTLELIKHMRNIICHNHPIYVLKYKKYKKNQTYPNDTNNKKHIIILYNKLFNENIKNIKLYNVVMLINLISPQKKDLCYWFKKEIDSFSSENNIDFSNNIKNFMNYK